jgi:hypothetical protein
VASGHARLRISDWQPPAVSSFLPSGKVASDAGGHAPPGFVKICLPAI